MYAVDIVVLDAPMRSAMAFKHIADSAGALRRRFAGFAL